VVPGTVTDGPAWVAMVRELRDTFGTDGVATQLGDALEWSFEPPMGGESTRVEVTPEPHGTRIRIARSKLTAARMGASMGAMFGVSGLALGALLFGFVGFDLAGLAFMLVLWVIGAAIAGLNIPMHRAAVRRDREQFNRLMDRLELIVLKTNAPSAQATTAEASEATSRLTPDVSALDDAPPAEAVNGTRERTRS
jgi:predicted lipid-binding transport protein (Tim44 family)